MPPRPGPPKSTRRPRDTVPGPLAVPARAKRLRRSTAAHSPSLPHPPRPMQSPTGPRPMVTVSGPAHLNGPGHAWVFRVAPVPGETTSSLICRIASRYGMEAKVLRACWKWRNYPPGHEGGGARADAEVLLNAAGRQLLAGICSVEEDVLARALPSWAEEDAKLRARAGDPVGLWRIGGAVAGPVAFGCRLCTAHRTGTAMRVMRYAPRWERVCVRHVAAGRGRPPAS